MVIIPACTVYVHYVDNISSPGCTFNLRTDFGRDTKKERQIEKIINRKMNQISCGAAIPQAANLKSQTTGSNRSHSGKNKERMSAIQIVCISIAFESLGAAVD